MAHPGAKQDNTRPGMSKAFQLFHPGDRWARNEVVLVFRTVSRLGQANPYCRSCSLFDRQIMGRMPPFICLPVPPLGLDRCSPREAGVRALGVQ